MTIIKFYPQNWHASKQLNRTTTFKYTAHIQKLVPRYLLAQSVKTVETPTASRQRGKIPLYHNECSRYDIKPSNGKAGALGNAEYPFNALFP